MTASDVLAMFQVLILIEDHCNGGLRGGVHALEIASKQEKSGRGRATEYRVCCDKEKAVTNGKSLEQIKRN